jgi:hypothetical protein
MDLSGRPADGGGDVTEGRLKRLSLAGSTSPDKNAAPPPLSLTVHWDKAKWHLDASSFPVELPRSAAWSHIIAAYRFLDERGQLTSAGKKALTDADEETALLCEHVKASARAFLDQTYEAYLKGIERYDQAPPLQILATAWERYTTRYDLRKRPRANAYQQLLLDYAHDRTTDALLRALNENPALTAHLREALADAPAVDRPLIEAVLAAREATEVSFAVSWPEPHNLLKALRYLDPHRDAAMQLRAACVLEDRLRKDNADSGELISLIHAVNLGATPAAEAAWRALSPPEQVRLSAAVNRLFGDGQETHLALCAMRTVGDAHSLHLIEQSVGDPREGVTQYSDGREEPTWERVRREARAAIRRRMQDG